MALSKQAGNQMPADESATARNQNSHFNLQITQNRTDSGTYPSVENRPDLSAKPTGQSSLGTPSGRPVTPNLGHLMEGRKSLTHDTMWSFASTGARALSTMVTFLLLTNSLGKEVFGLYIATLPVSLGHRSHCHVRGLARGGPADLS